MLGLRVTLIALGALLGLVLLSQGFYLVGTLILCMAVVRAVLVVRLRHRMNERVARRSAFRSRLEDRHRR